MYTLRIITTIFIVILMLIILIFSKGLKWPKDNASIVGFSVMEVVYALSLICIWIN